MAQRQRAPDAPLAIDGYGDGGFRIQGRRHEGSQLLLGGTVQDWPVGDPPDPASLTPDDFAVFLTSDHPPDVLVLGIGSRTRHPSAAVRRAFREAGIGLEVLDTPAACRLYNLIAAESRRVGAALIAV